MFFCYNIINTNASNSAAHCNTLQHTASHCNTQHIAPHRDRWNLEIHFRYETITATHRDAVCCGLFCKRALQKRLYSAKETHNFKEPTNRSHPIWQVESGDPFSIWHNHCHTPRRSATHRVGAGIWRCCPVLIESMQTMLSVGTLQHTASRCNTLQHTSNLYDIINANDAFFWDTATHCKTLQDNVTHWNRATRPDWRYSSRAKIKPPGVLFRALDGRRNLDCGVLWQQTNKRTAARIQPLWYDQYKGCFLLGHCKTM